MSDSDSPESLGDILGEALAAAAQGRKSNHAMPDDFPFIKMSDMIGMAFDLKLPPINMDPHAGMGFTMRDYADPNPHPSHFVTKRVLNTDHVAKINRIKAYRDTHRCSLLDAKRIVEGQMLAEMLAEAQSMEDIAMIKTWIGTTSLIEP